MADNKNFPPTVLAHNLRNQALQAGVHQQQQQNQKQLRKNLPSPTIVSSMIH